MVTLQTNAKKELATPGITSIANASGGITIKYSKVTGANGYIIYRKAGTGSWTQRKTYTSVVSSVKSAYRKK